MSILRRVRNVIAARLQPPTTPPADPGKVLTDLLHQAESLFTDFQVAYNRAVADHLAARERLARARAEAGKWEEYAARALAQGREDIARQALVSKQAALGSIPDLEQVCANLDASVSALQQTDQELRGRLDRLRAQRDRIAASQHAAAASVAAGAVADALDPLALGGVLDQIEQALLDEQARAAARAELAGLGPSAAGSQAGKDPSQR